MHEENDKRMRMLEDKRNKGRIFRKDSENLKVEENVFDVPTLKLLYTLSNKGYIEEMGGSISTGKEANLFYAKGRDGRENAVKIYRISSSTFQAMDPYIFKDPRFMNIRHSRKDIIFAWTRKEYQNLLRVRRADIPAPEPLLAERNILLMEFIGENGRPYPRLKEARLTDEEAGKVFDTVCEYMRRMFIRARLVHADLSEYNILIDPHTTAPIIIDVGQAVTLEHPHFREFLVRDIGNILRFFRKYGIRSTTEDVLKIVREKRPEDEPYIRKIREEEEAAENADENEDAEEDAQGADAEEDAQSADAEEDAQSADAEEDAQSADAEEDAQREDAEEDAQREDAEEDAQREDAEEDAQHADAEEDAQRADTEEDAQSADAEK
ncbi:MAG: hypothetical protein II940_04505 [Methanosarcinaceae archaeon]|nr:hypothetical protein [Methanosarcinaceae archaeon]